MAESGEVPALESDHRSFSAGAVLFYAGAPANELFLIRAGRVRLLKRARGVERTIGVFGPGELVGEGALLPGAHRGVTAEALEPVTAMVVDSATFRALVRKRPDVGEGAMRQLVTRLRRAEAELERALVPDPTLRVLDALLEEHDLGEGPVLPLSPLELSNRAALDLDQVKAVVGQLRERGYLEVGDQTITIEDASPLRALHDLLAVKEDVRHGPGCR